MTDQPRHVPVNLRAYTVIAQRVHAGVTKGIHRTSQQWEMPDGLREALRKNLDLEVLAAVCEVLSFDDPNGP